MEMIENSRIPTDLHASPASLAVAAKLTLSSEVASPTNLQHLDTSPIYQSTHLHHLTSIHQSSQTPIRIQPTTILSMADKELKTLHQALITGVSKGDYTSASRTLSSLKLALLTRNALLPTASTPTPILLLAREVLEIGALTSIHQTDDAAFSRYYSQLQPFYEDHRLTAASPSPHRSKIVGLHLLLLLSKNDIADFHTTLENLEADMEKDPFVRHPIMLERWLMEGSYDKVWNATKSSQMPSEEYALFSQVSWLVCLGVMEMGWIGLM